VDASPAATPEATGPAPSAPPPAAPAAAGGPVTSFLAQGQGWVAVAVLAALLIAVFLILSAVVR
jgi:hypothetical protein